MEKTIEIQLAEQAKKFIDRIESTYNLTSGRTDYVIGMNVGLSRAVEIIRNTK